MDAGYDVMYRDSANTAEELIRLFDKSEFAAKRFLFVRGDRSMRTVPELLGESAEVDEVIVYETKELSLGAAEREKIRKRLRANEIDWVCFFSPSAVESFGRLFAHNEWARPRAAVIGATTAKSAEAEGFRVGFIAETPNLETFANGLAAHIKVC